MPDERDEGVRQPAAGKEQISPRLPLPLIELLREEAEENKRTLSAQVEVILEAHYDRKDQPDSKK